MFSSLVSYYLEIHELHVEVISRTFRPRWSKGFEK